MREKQKREERIYLDALLSSDEIPSAIQITESERPDFLLSTAQGQVGVEVTTLHIPPTAPGSRRWEGACEAVLAAADSHWRTSGRPPLHASVTFDKSVIFEKAAWSKWGERLSNTVFEAIPSVGKQVVIGLGAPEWLKTETPCPTGVKTIIVSRHAEMNEPWWTLSTGGTVPDLEFDLLQSAIEAKSTQVSSYAIGTSELWLIVGLDPHRYSSEFNLRDAPALDKEYRAAFDRVFLVKPFHNPMYELDLVRA